MKSNLPILFAIIISLVGCTKEDEAKIVIDIYSPDKPMGATISGDFDPSPRDLFLDGKFVGTTPVIFTQDDLEKYELPQYEMVVISPTENWYTWDSDGHGGFVVSHPGSRDKKRHLEFRTRDNNVHRVVHFGGMVRNGDPQSTVSLYAKIPLLKDAEQAGTGQPANRPELKSEGSDKPQPESEGRSR
jgi:hypothetical protein